MATFKQYKKKNGEKAWLVTAYLGVDYVTGKQVNVTIRNSATKKEAQSKLIKRKLDFENGLKKPNTIVTFEEIYLLWLDNYKRTVKEITFNNTKRSIEKHVLPVFGTMKMQRLTLTYLQKKVDDWSTKMNNYTFLFRYILRVVDYAVSIEMVDTNIFRKLIRPQKNRSTNKTKIKFYTKEQLEQFLNFTNKNIASLYRKSPLTQYYAESDRAIFRLLAFSGLRISEALALNWDDINFSNNSISINKSLTRVTDGFVVSSTKTQSSNRNIILDVKTIQVLKKWKLKQCELLFANGITQINFAFTDFNGKMINRLDIYQRSQNIASKAGLPNIGCHGFRHTHATMLFEAGVNPKKVQARLGHSSITITLDTYTHVTIDSEKEILDKLIDHIPF